MTDESKEGQQVRSNDELGGSATLDTFIEQMDLLVDDWRKYENGDRLVPFAVVRDSVVAMLNEYTENRTRIVAAMLLTPNAGVKRPAGREEL